MFAILKLLVLCLAPWPLCSVNQKAQYASLLPCVTLPHVLHGHLCMLLFLYSKHKLQVVQPLKLPETVSLPPSPDVTVPLTDSRLGIWAMDTSSIAVWLLQGNKHIGFQRLLLLFQECLPHQSSTSPWKTRGTWSTTTLYLSLSR